MLTPPRNMSFSLRRILVISLLLFMIGFGDFYGVCGLLIYSEPIIKEARVQFIDRPGTGNRVEVAAKRESSC